MGEQKKYYLGLDIGTDSVGWCVTDENYNIIKKNADREGKHTGVHLWGARLFTEAKDCSGRRKARGARRRLARRRRRILMLQEIFKPEMDKIDSSFFDRLNNSALHYEDKDKDAQAENLLFNEKSGLNDSNYFKTYPTIYHLRKKMIDNPKEKFDLRQIYLVLAHMIKYRGNFLKEGEMKAIGSDPSVVKDGFASIDSILTVLNESLADEDEGEEKETSYSLFNITGKIASSLLELFKQDMRISDLLEKEETLFNIKNSNRDIRVNILKAINGSSLSLKSFFPKDCEDDEDLGKTKIDFGKNDFVDNTLPSLPDIIGDDKASLFMAIKGLYDFRLLVNILKGQEYVSYAMVNIYDCHKVQLEGLKDLYKKYARKQYAYMFRTSPIKSSKDKKKDDGETEKAVNYSGYVGYLDVKGKKIRCEKSVSEDELFKRIQADLPFDKIDDPLFVWKDPNDKDLLASFKKLHEEGKFLPKQNSSKNGVLPYQLNDIEMNIIIDNQKAFYPFLGEMAADFNNPKKQSYKIVDILKYKVPYYVGPLSKDKKGYKAYDNHWMVRNEGMEDVKITPFNFHDVVDEDKTEEAFIKNLKNPCTYLIGEETLPSNSLLYTKFVLLNEMNNWLINGEPITTEDKNYLFNNLYLKKKKVGLKALQAALKAKYKTDDFRIETSTGKELDEEDMHASLKPYIDMMDSRGFGPGFINDDKKIKEAEGIIFDSTMFEDKNIVMKRMDKRKDLSEEQKKYFSSLAYKGWGKLSRKLLEGIKTKTPNEETGEYFELSIIDLLERTSLNFMRIYSEHDKEVNFDFEKQVDDLNGEQNVSLDEIIDNEYVAPSMKRSLRQSFKIIDELKKILKIQKFDKYFVECTRRPDDDKKRTNSRKKQLEAIYAQAKGIVDEEVKANLEKTDDAKLRGKKYFRYFLQLGKSVYTGEKINFEDIDKNYDIDHIIPQAKLKDDSLLNTVLVEKSVNIDKSDTYPVPNMTRKGREWVDTLNKIGSKGKPNILMPKDKMNRILRVNPLSEKEEVGFVNRQLTMTNQAVKAVCDVLKRLDKDADVVYSKAWMVSDFRKAFNMLKCRDVNDFHHANDAYLNIVVGDVYNEVFTKNFSVEKLLKKKTPVKFDVEHFLSNDRYSFNSNNCVWKAKKYTKDSKTGAKIEVEGSQGTLDIVRKYMAYQDPMVTQMLTTQVGKQGFFNKIGIKTACEASAVMPLKASAPFNSEGYESKYGGYNDLCAPYYMLVKSEGKKGKHIYSLENIPTVYQSLFKNEEQIKGYLTNKLGLINPEIIFKKLLIRTVLELNSPEGKCKVGIRAKTGNSIALVNLSELHIKKEYSDYIRSISKLFGVNLLKNSPKPNLDRFKDEMNSISVDSYSYTREKNIEVFNYICDDIYARPCYSMLPEVSGTLEKIQGLKECFSELKLLDQMRVLLLCIKLIKCNPDNISDLSLLGLGTNAGTIRFNKTLNSGIKIISQSPTGFYEKVLFTVPEDK